MGPASVRTEGGEAARGNDFVLVDGDGRAEMATAWVSSCGVRGMRALEGGGFETRFGAGRWDDSCGPP